MKKVTLLGLGSIFLLAGSSKAGPLIDFEISIGAIQQKPSGYVSYKAVSDIRDRIDLKNDARLEDKTQPWARLKFEHPIPIIPNIKLAYMPVKLEGSGTLRDIIKWGGYEFEANTDFNLSVKLDRVDTTLYYNFPFIKTATAGKLDVEFGLNVRTIMFGATLSGTTVDNEIVSESASITLPVPMGHLAVEIRPINLVSLVGELNYIGYKNNAYYDYVAGLRLSPPVRTPLKPFVEVGYRHEKLKIDERDVKTELNIKGLYGLVGVRF
ncbi:MAG: TIGR04219 family outer membrane beta-barrel protein [Thermocrinis sp.]|jgi:outer membrane protein|uniref:TIGR04219 family outer membrane beta-barrel protein n=1 Tax=Thermocrinis sp. TaxID=2024383 RepID=UPI003BFE95C0